MGWVRSPLIILEKKMNAQDFCFWLQGMFELTNTKTLSKQQVEIIRNHLQLVFTKVTPDVDIEKENDDGLSSGDILKILDKIKDDTEPYVYTDEQKMPQQPLWDDHTIRCSPRTGDIPDYTIWPETACKKSDSGNNGGGDVFC